MAADEFAFLDTGSEMHQFHSPRVQALRRLRLGGGAGLVTRVAIARVERYSQRPAAALGRVERHCRRLPLIPPGNTNGNTVDRQGRLLSCEHGGRRVSRTEFDGTVVTIADNYEGKRLNSPNDVAVKSDDSIWFTDPAYGIESDYEGHRRRWSWTAATSSASIPPPAISGSWRKTSCVQTASLSRRTKACSTSPIPALRTVQTGRATSADSRSTRITRSPEGEVFATCTAGFFDGFRLDVDGRVWASAADGVHVYDPDGTLIGKVFIAEVVANVEFGGTKRNHLFICGTTSLYTVKVMTNGARRI